MNKNSVDDNIFEAQVGMSRFEAVPAEFARELQSEIITLRDWIRQHEEQIELLIRENGELLEEEKRLEWIIVKAPYEFFPKLSSDPIKGRKQIDAAMKDHPETNFGMRKEAQP